MELPFNSISELLLRQRNEDPILRFIRDRRTPDSAITHKVFTTRAAVYGSNLLAAGLQPGDRLGIIPTDAEQFLLTFFGAMHVGLIPVPISPPVSSKQFDLYLQRVLHILQASQADALVVSPAIRRFLGSLDQPRLLLSSDTLEAPGQEAALCSGRIQDLAFLQFTSGSTSQPKGVTVTHENIFHNTAAIGEALQINPETDVFCSWLPLFHDMGLIGFCMTPLVHGCSTVLMPPELFTKRPIEWLQMISDNRGTISFAPNFAYGLSTKRITENELSEIDLSSWRVAGCGAEPIQADTLRGFIEKFREVGFSETALLPAYGMAESTLAIAFPKLGTPLKTDTIYAQTLADTRVAIPAKDESTAVVEIVSCGHALKGFTIRIIDADGSDCPERTIGEILLSGPSVTSGYYRSPKATIEALEDGWLHTGDLGYFADGELYVCGRIKETIIIAGQNHHPTDIEWVVSDVEGVRKGNVIAIGIQSLDRADELVLLAETKLDQNESLALQRAIVTQIRQATGLVPAEVVLLAPGSLPKTSSGKLQRAQARQAYLEGTLEPSGNTAKNWQMMHQLVVSQWGFVKRWARS